VVGIRYGITKTSSSGYPASDAYLDEHWDGYSFNQHITL